MFDSLSMVRKVKLRLFSLSRSCTSSWRSGSIFHGLTGTLVVGREFRGGFCRRRAESALVVASIVDEEEVVGIFTPADSLFDVPRLEPSV